MIVVVIVFFVVFSVYVVMVVDIGVSIDVVLSVQMLDIVFVIGQGEICQVQCIIIVDKQVLLLGISGQKIFDCLLGVLVQFNDVFGVNEELQIISLCGFDKSCFGYMLDGILLGDNSYGNYNGLSIVCVIIVENLVGVELLQGIGLLGVVLISNLGGIFQYFLMDLFIEFGGCVSVIVGDNNQCRGYLCVDIGDINGFLVYVFGVYQDQDMWVVLYQNQIICQFNVKVVWNVGDYCFGVFVVILCVSQVNYVYLFKDMLVCGLGYDWNIYVLDWDCVVVVVYCVLGIYNKVCCKFSGGVNSIDDVYYQSCVLCDDNFYLVDVDLCLGEQGCLKLLVYYYDNCGQGYWWVLGQLFYLGIDRMLLILICSINYMINCDGLIVVLLWMVGIYELEVGLWYEQNDYNVLCNFYYISGLFLDDLYLKNLDCLLFNQDFDICMCQFYVQDCMCFFDQCLIVDVGIKSLNICMCVIVQLGVEISIVLGMLIVKKLVLLQVGLGFKFNVNNELFVLYVENIVVFVGGGSGGLLQVLLELFVVSVGLELEKFKSLEVGFCIFGEKYQVLIVVYNVKFDNCLLLLNLCLSIEVGMCLECVMCFINVGLVKSYGVELIFIFKLIDGLQWYNVLFWNKIIYEDDYILGGVIVLVVGKIMVDMLQCMVFSEISWNCDGFFVSLCVKYIGKCYYIYINDQLVLGVIIFDVGVGYDFGFGLGLCNVWVLLNVINLINKCYVGQLSLFVLIDLKGMCYVIYVSVSWQLFMMVVVEF